MSDDNKITGSKATEPPKGAGSENEPHEYWTEERRAEAIPVPLPKGSAGEQGAELPEQAGEPGHVPPGHPKSDHKHADPKDESESGGNAVAHPQAYPYSTCGKIFFTQAGKNYSGSASVIAPNVLLTAGHCVHGGGAWSTNVTFYPSYPIAGAPHFSYSYVAAWSAWSANSNRAFDYGMVWVDNAPGNKVGWLGLLWNAPTAGRVWEAVGYPATPSPPFNGSTMDSTVGTVASSSTAGTIGLTNDNMEHGSSGGPWITNFNGPARQYANGLQSFHINDGDFTEYGPYFTADAKGLLDWISNAANRK